MTKLCKTCYCTWGRQPSLVPRLFSRKRAWVRGWRRPPGAGEEEWGGGGGGGGVALTFEYLVRTVLCPDDLLWLSQQTKPFQTTSASFPPPAMSLFCWYFWVPGPYGVVSRGPSMTFSTNEAISNYIRLLSSASNVVVLLVLLSTWSVRCCVQRTFYDFLNKRSHFKLNPPPFLRQQCRCFVQLTVKVGSHEGTCCRDMSRGRMRCSHEGACCGDRFLEVFTRRVLSQGHVLISFSDWFIFRSVAGTCRMNSSHEATLRLTRV